MFTFTKRSIKWSVVLTLAALFVAPFAGFTQTVPPQNPGTCLPRGDDHAAGSSADDESVEYHFTAARCGRQKS